MVQKIRCLKCKNKQKQHKNLPKSDKFRVKLFKMLEKEEHQILSMPIPEKIFKKIFKICRKERKRQELYLTDEEAERGMENFDRLYRMRFR